MIFIIYFLFLLFFNYNLITIFIFLMNNSNFCLLLGLYKSRLINFLLDFIRFFFLLFFNNNFFLIRLDCLSFTNIFNWRAFPARLFSIRPSYHNKLSAINYYSFWLIFRFTWYTLLTNYFLFKQVRISRTATTWLIKIYLGFYNRWSYLKWLLDNSMLVFILLSIAIERSNEIL